MNKQKTDLPAEWWLNNLGEVDHEIARLATVCDVRILDRGIVERVLHNDASVCGRANPVAFAKLRGMLMLHFAIRQKTADVVGQAEAAEIERYVIEELRKTFPDLPAEWRPV